MYGGIPHELRSPGNTPERNILHDLQGVVLTRAGQCIPRRATSKMRAYIGIHRS